MLPHELGKHGEELAAEFLLESGFKVLARNFRTRRGEIDLVCQRGEKVILVEVKTRSENYWGVRPSEAVDKCKKASIQLAAREYRSLSSWYGDLQLMVISVLIRNGQKPEIELLEEPF